MVSFWLFNETNYGQLADGSTRQRQRDVENANADV